MSGTAAAVEPSTARYKMAHPATHPLSTCRQRLLTSARATSPMPQRVHPSESHFCRPPAHTTARSAKAAKALRPLPLSPGGPLPRYHEAQPPPPRGFHRHGKSFGLAVGRAGEHGRKEGRVADSGGERRGTLGAKSQKEAIFTFLALCVT